MEKEFFAKGINGQVFIENNKVIIERKGFFSFLQGLKGRKEIFIKKISSIQIKKAGLTNGYIQLTIPGTKEANISSIQLTKDENTIHFYKKHQENFIVLKNEIENRIEKNNNSTNIQNTSIADELEKFARLKEKGVLSEEEFQKKKEKLLNQ